MQSRRENKLRKCSGCGLNEHMTQFFRGFTFRFAHCCSRAWCLQKRRFIASALKRELKIGRKRRNWCQTTAKEGG